MNDPFQDLIDITMGIYLHNILIFLEKMEEHPEHLSKYHFQVTTVDYLGIVISPARLSTDEKKIEAVTTWPMPRTVKQVQAFVGSVACPLHNLTKKEIPWSWGNLEEEAFQELKCLVTKSPVLIHSNSNLPYHLETDTSGVAMGAIFSQRGTDNQLHPVAHMSKSFSGVQLVSIQFLPSTVA
ncbi:Retrotransposable element Tf2 protein [Rhizoctonia solani]|uniref:Retrotransposable element Tf2 protein n=1 Tax=Rhizoctonia solani TaxID=456999 RepID=A0A8H8PDU1_9AGAM|nr:Retrotransposable element Tf2 protein [Rhizoctonia solani]QRW27797.1 Retrotransposable element Tf2 protein [Rhizoctonia solani]